MSGHFITLGTWWPWTLPAQGCFQDTTFYLVQGCFQDETKCLFWQGGWELLSRCKQVPSPEILSRSNTADWGIWSCRNLSIMKGSYVQMLKLIEANLPSVGLSNCGEPQRDAIMQVGIISPLVGRPTGITHFVVLYLVSCLLTIYITDVTQSAKSAVFWQKLVTLLIMSTFDSIECFHFSTLEQRYKLFHIFSEVWYVYCNKARVFSQT